MFTTSELCLDLSRTSYILGDICQQHGVADKPLSRANIETGLEHYGFDSLSRRSEA